MAPEHIVHLDAYVRESGIVAAVWDTRHPFCAIISVSAMLESQFWNSYPGQNRWWAAGYNLFEIPLAAGILASWGTLLTPAIGAVLMSMSTVIVAINAQLMRRVKL